MSTNDISMTFLELLDRVNEKKQQTIKASIDKTALTADIMAVFASPKEKELHQLLDSVIAAENMQPIQLLFKATQHSTAVSTTRSITMCSHDMKSDKHPNFASAILLHEIAHHIMFDAKDLTGAHNKKFQKIETILCKNHLGLIPIYAQDRGYATVWMDKTTNEIVFSWTGYPPGHQQFGVSR